MSDQNVDSSNNHVPHDRTNLKVRREFTGAALDFEAWAEPGTDDGDSKWQIAAFTVDAQTPPNILTKNFAQAGAGDKETNGFVFKWTDRATLTYGV